MSRLIILILFSIPNFGFSQTPVIYDNDSLRSLIIQDADSFRHINPSFYAMRYKNKRSRLLYLNDNLIDSSGINFKKIYGPYKGRYRAYNETFPERNLKVYELTMSDEIVNELYSSNDFVPYTYHFGASRDGEGDKVFKLSNSGKPTEFTSLDGLFEYYETLRSADQIWSLTEVNDKTVIVEGCPWDGGCSYYRYFYASSDTLYELSFNNIKTNVQTRTGEEEENFRVYFYFSHYDYDFLMAGVDFGNLPENTDLIFSKDLEDTTHIIKKHQPFQIIGENIQEGKNQLFYLRSQLDNGEKVIVSYKVDQAFEEVAYDIFKNHIINKSQIRGFNEYQLGILKNLIFAKYNYAFSTDFYQAYFNLFEFYHDEKMRASRTKDMSGLLTGTDTKNLEVINTALKKYN